MGYTALYRKFRPTTFGEMVGQEHITKTIKNQIISGRVGHAYLFNGCRGTGKTSAAKILARAVNCLNPQEGEPCNNCEICKEAISGALTDIVEMDAASNNSVEDIRTIREEVNFLPSKAKYRVYIIDEVHMLSTGAFNALLKTLEEPPEHVKFILATTEPQKLPATILSRCQRFDFKRISNQDIIKRLKIVCKESEIEITEEALNIVAVLSEGAMRDALSILERCVQDGNNNIDEDKIKELVGIPKRTYIHGITQAIIEYNVDEALEVTNKVLEEGKDLNNFLWETIKYVKDILICKANGKIELYNEQEMKELKELSEKITKQRAIQLIYDFSKLENDIKLSTQKIIVFEAGIISLCNKQEEGTYVTQTSGNVGVSVNTAANGELAQRINKIENYIRNNKIAMQQSTNNAKNVENANPNEVKTKIKIPLGKTQEYWPQIVEELKKNRKMTVYTNLINTTAREINDNVIGVEFPNGLTGFGKTVLESQDNLKMVNDLISTACGKQMQVKYIDSNIHEVEYKDAAENELTNLANGNGIPFNILE
ncbi:MAG: DNA polymerase III subunit gamma/tau [Clostridia bacterium]|nr:DNA polymerase III subunit gamma/tau [Clostridia bacterium]